MSLIFCAVFLGIRQQGITGKCSNDIRYPCMQAVLPQLDTQDAADTGASLLAFAAAACASVGRMQPAASGSSVGATFARAAPLLGAPADGTRRAAADTLRDICRSCIATGAAAQEPPHENGAPSGLRRAAAALVAALQPAYHDAWGIVLPVVADFIRAAGPDQAAVVEPLLAPLADMCRCAARSVSARLLSARLCPLRCQI